MSRRIINRIASARKSGDIETARRLIGEMLERKPDDVRTLHQLGLLHAAQGRWEDALNAFRRCAEQTPDDLTCNRRMADALLATGRFAQARTLASRIVKRAPAFNERDHVRLSLACSFCGDYRAAREVFVRAFARWRRNQPSSPVGEPLIIAAMPKTASTSLAHALGHALGWPVTDLLCHSGPHLFNHTVIIGRNLAQSRGIGLIGHTHMLPRRANLRVLAAHPQTRLVVHFRDPRDALVSALDMFHRMRAGQFLLREPKLADWPLEKQVDWMLKHYLPLQIGWLEGWKRALDAKMPQIVAATTFNRLASEGQDTLAREICHLLRRPVVNETPSAPRRYGKRRLGSWREIFTPAQKRKAERLLGDSLRIMPD